MINKMIKKHINVIHVLIVFSFLVIIIFVIWICFFSSIHTFQNNLRLISSKIVSNPNMDEITGQIKNGTNKEFLYTDVVFNLYDNMGNKVGQVEDNSGDLKPGAIWNFDAIGNLASAKTYKVEEIIGT